MTLRCITYRFNFSAYFFHLSLVRRLKFTLDSLFTAFVKEKKTANGSLKSTQHINLHLASFIEWSKKNYIYVIWLDVYCEIAI